MKVGEGIFTYVVGSRNPSKPSKSVDKQIPKINLLQHMAGSVPNRFIYSQCKRRLLSNGAIE